MPLPSIDEASPWLVPHDSESTSIKAPKKNNEIVVGKDSTAMTKWKNKLKKIARKRGDEKAKTIDDAVVEISADKVLMLPSPKTSPVTSTNKPAAPVKKASRPPSTSVDHPGGGDDDDDDVHSEVEEQEKALSNKGKAVRHAFEQRDLVALAFAGDNVVHVSFPLLA